MRIRRIDGFLFGIRRELVSRCILRFFSEVSIRIWVEIRRF